MNTLARNMIFCWIFTYDMFYVSKKRLLLVFKEVDFDLSLRGSLILNVRKRRSVVLTVIVRESSVVLVE